jgi:hypothetical protein
MRLLEKEKSDMIYEIEDSFDGIPEMVTVDIGYSSGEGTNELEFEYAVVSEELNTSLTEEQIRVCNKVLECGREEEYVRILAKYYEITSYKFIPNHYEI